MLFEKDLILKKNWNFWWDLMMVFNLRIIVLKYIG